MDAFSGKVPSKVLENKWILGLTGLEVYSSVFDIGKERKGKERKETLLLKLYQLIEVNEFL